jgi:hypothetical protein
MGENQPAKTGRCSTPVSLTCKQWAERQVQAKAAQYKDDDAAALKFLGGSSKDDYGIKDLQQRHRLQEKGR